MREIGYFLLLLVVLFSNAVFARVSFNEDYSLAKVGINGDLYTDSRWIVNEGGKRVKLSCVNLAGHLETLVPAGLDKKPMDEITNSIAMLGFNCVRLTWAIPLPTNKTLASTTVFDRFTSLGLDQAIDGIQRHNPEFLNLTTMQAYQTVVRKLGDSNVMVILDNHVSKPIWCCSRTDGNGFFGDTYFDPDLWVDGLTKMATLFKDSKNVIGMSLRNELRGPNQNVTLWYRYMQRGAEAVHSVNKRVLVILSGLQFDNDLGFLKQQQVKLSFTRKLVFEVHRYGISLGEAWQESAPNELCGNFTQTFMSNAGFLLDQGFPLFLSEFGGDQRGNNTNDNRFANCFYALVADLDLDWAFWTFEGSYYSREGEQDSDEAYGIMNHDWTEIRNKTVLQKLQSIQKPLRGPGLPSVEPYNMIYHSATGQCVTKEFIFGPLKLGPCSMSNAWTYISSRKTIELKGTKFCLSAVGIGKRVRVGADCSSSSSKWEMYSHSKLQLSTTLGNGERVCLDHHHSNGIMMTNSCKCLKEDVECDPGNQWFKIINSTRV